MQLVRIIVLFVRNDEVRSEAGHHQVPRVADGEASSSMSRIVCKSTDTSLDHRRQYLKVDLFQLNKVIYKSMHVSDLEGFSIGMMFTPGE